MYTVGDFLIQIQNAYKAHKRSLTCRYSTASLSIAKLLQKEGYIKDVKVEKSATKKNVNELVIDLKYINGIAPLSHIKLVSRPSVHYYFDKSHLRKTYLGRGISILSTSHGIMTGKEAGKTGIGGELICHIY